MMVCCFYMIDKYSYVQEQEHAIREAAGLVKVSPAELGKRLAGLIDDRKRLERELSTPGVPWRRAARKALRMSVR